MRKWIALVLAAMLAFSGCALAEKDSEIVLIATGEVVAGDVISVKAPFGGVISDIAAATGDRVSADDLLLTMDTIKIYAPVSGHVRGILAESGESAANVLSQYGALLYIEPDTRIVSINQSKAYIDDDGENLDVHVGETVYLRSTKDNDRTGIGRIVSLGMGTFTVEIGENDLEEDDVVHAFRDEDHDTETRLGRGTVTEQAPMAIAGDGAIVSVNVADGEYVRKGDILLEVGMGSFSAFKARTSKVLSPADGIVAAVSAQEGLSAQMDQIVLSLCPNDALEISVYVDEMDLDKVHEDAEVRVSFDSMPDAELSGTVKSISALGMRVSGGAQYEVRILLEETDEVRLGLSATVYFPEN